MRRLVCSLLVLLLVSASAARSPQVHAVSAACVTFVDVALQPWGWTDLGSVLRIKHTPEGYLSWNIKNSGYVYTDVTHANHTLKTQILPPLSELQTLVITARIVTTGAPTFDYGFGPSNPCSSPASAHPFLWRGDDVGKPGDVGKLTDPYARWWAQGPIWLETGPEPQTYRVPMTANMWSSVYGKFANDNPTAADAWQRTLAGPTAVGMTFGGGCFFGHGVLVRHGTAHFELQDYHFE